MLVTIPFTWIENLCFEVELASEPTPEYSGVGSSTPECFGVFGFKACTVFGKVKTGFESLASL